MLWIIVVALVVPILAPAAAAEGPDVSGLLQKVGEAYGGPEVLAECPGFRARGKILSLVDGMNGAVAISLSLEGAMRVEVRYPNRAETRILSGKLAWDGGRRRQTPSEHSMGSSIRLQFHRLAAPFELVGADPKLFQVDGVSEEGWIRLRRDWPGDLYTIYEIEAETGRIRRTRGVIVSEDGDLEFVSESYDFREVDGLQFPFRTTTWVGEHVAAETILDRITIGGDFAPTTFVPSNTGGDI